MPIGWFWTRHAWFEVLEWRIVSIDGSAVLRWALLHRGRSLELFALAVSLIIPTGGLQQALLVNSVATLLNMAVLKRPGSQIVLSHYTNASVGRIESLRKAVAATCDEGTLIQVDSVRENVQFGPAHRYAVAAEVSTGDVVMHLDDDMLPSEALLNAMITNANEKRGMLWGYRKFVRKCSSDGYICKGPPDVICVPHQSGTDTANAAHDFSICRPSAPHQSSTYALTGVSAMARELSSQFVISVQLSEAAYGPLLRKTDGNGEDLVFNHWALKSGYQVGWIACPQLVQSAPCLQEIVVARGEHLTSYSSKPKHYHNRNKICKCLSEKQLVHGNITRGLSGKQLVHCVATVAAPAGC